MASQSTSFPPHNASPRQTRVTIIGGGVVGSALASYLSSRISSSQIILLDPSPTSPAGSTSIAPGLVGQFNTIPHLTEVAKETVKTYAKIPGAFHKVGGLEIASTREGTEQLHHRHELARACGLEAEILTSKEAADLAPDFHAEDADSVGLFFPSDGTADPLAVTRHFQEQAKAHGVSIVPAKVFGISVGKDEKISLTADQGVLETEKLIVAAGIWTPILLQILDINLPIISVAHPYAHGPSRDRREKQRPFVRWPERHVYARDHGECDGFGTYGHNPVVVIPEDSAKSERGPEPEILESALSVFPSLTRGTKVPYKVSNGIFAVTPDGMPFAGAVPQIPGLYVAAAVWITHAAGVARLVANIVSGKELSTEDEVLREAFDPLRFEGQQSELLKEKALRTYNDIYNKSRC